MHIVQSIQDGIDGCTDLLNAGRGVGQLLHKDIDILALDEIAQHKYRTALRGIFAIAHHLYQIRMPESQGGLLFGTLTYHFVVGIGVFHPFDSHGSTILASEATIDITHGSAANRWFLWVVTVPLVHDP
jgi:hypothetical protein